MSLTNQVIVYADLGFFVLGIGSCSLCSNWYTVRQVEQEIEITELLGSAQAQVHSSQAQCEYTNFFKLHMYNIVYHLFIQGSAVYQ